MHSFLRYATRHQSATVNLIERLAACESPSDSPQSVNDFVDLMVAETKDLARAKRTKITGFGDVLRLQFQLPGKRKTGQVLGLGHSDTVWPKDTLRHMPLRRSRGRLCGPGVLDMKSGLAFFISAARLIRDLDQTVHRNVVLLVVPDEEVGSPQSRSTTEAEAKRSNFVLVLEPGTGLSGKLKTARKGVGRYTVSIQGKAAHSGVDFGNGASAILEAAEQIRRIAAMTEQAGGTTVNPGVIRGGTRSNVVAADAVIEVDMRAVTGREANLVDRKLRGLRPVDKRCSIQVDGGLNRPPMERTRAIAALFSRAQGIAAGMGLALEESSTGGGSDGNFTAALGIPTLDGLGGVGEGAHAVTESILMNRIADRVALLAGLLVGL